MTQRDEDAVVQEEETKETTTQGAEEEFDLTLDDRAKIYEQIDAKNRGGKTSIVFGQRDEDLAATDEGQSTEEGQPETDATETDEPPTKAQEGTEGEGDEPPEPKVLSRAEFMEVFKDFRIKDKIAGEEVEAPVSEWVKATGLERHYTKRLQELSRREREVLQAAKDHPGSTAEGEQIPGIPSDEEIEETYNDLYQESPFKARQYLQNIENKKETYAKGREIARIDKAVADFKASYPECTDADWDKMNDPDFWSKHDDVVKMKDSGDVFATLVTAYTRLQQSQVVSDASDATRNPPKKETRVDRVTRKKEGQVIRTTISPPPKKATAPQKTREQMDREYIAQLRATARSRMRIPD